MYPPYSPDLALSEYHLFRSLQNSLNSVKLISKEVKITCHSFSSRNQKFYSDGIMVLLQKWQKVVEQNKTTYLV